MGQLLKRVWQMLHREGLWGVIGGVVYMRDMQRLEASYAQHIKEEKIANNLCRLESGLRFSIVMPVFNSNVEWLREAVDSVRRQTYMHWELCIADDASTHVAIKPALEDLAAEDHRIKVCFRKQNGHISAASNSAIKLATGEWMVLLDQDDVLAEDALMRIIQAMNQDPQAKLFYSDEDKIDADGRRFEPYFKPDWNVDLLYSQNYFNHLGVYNLDLVRKVGCFREGFEGAQDHDLILRCMEQVTSDQIVHIPHVLYHWRVHDASTAGGGGAKNYAQQAGVRALSEHFSRMGVVAHVSKAAAGYRVRYEVPRTYTKSIFRLDDENLREQVAEGAGADMLLFLRDRVAVPDDDSWQELCSLAAQQGVGVVAPRVWMRGGRLWSGGVMLDGDHCIKHVCHGKPRGYPGYMNRLSIISGYPAVAAECFVCQKSVYDAVGGFNTNYSGLEMVVDFCNRLKMQGYRHVVTSYANVLFRVWHKRSL